MKPEEVLNWKAPEDSPAQQPEAADAAPVAAKPKPRKPRKPSAPKAKKPLANTGWFIECYPLVKDSNGGTVADLAKMSVFGPIEGARNERDVMPHLKALADTDPGSVAGHSVRIVKVAAVMSPKVRQVVDFD